jgi:hypothetical protein
VVFSDLFTVREVELIGGELLAGERPDLPTGGNIFFWRPPADLVNAPRVSGFSIERQYWQRKIVLRLEARDRYAIWCVEGQDTCLWVDSAGIAFSEAPNLEGVSNLHLVRDISTRTLSPGDKVLGEELFPYLVTAFTFLDTIDADVERFTVDELKFKEAVAEIKEGPDIYFSLSVDPGFALGVVQSLRQSGDWDTIKYLDLRVPNRAYYSG